jgi:hypothetical protein
MKLPTTRGRQGGQQSKYHVKKEYWELAVIGMDDVLKSMKLTFSNRSIGHTGDAVLSSLSKQAYVKHYRGLRLFFCMLGDYESLLMLQENAPEKFCPSMNADNIALFIKWKRTAKSEYLTESSGNIINDVLGQPVLCDGGWNDPKNVKQFMSAVRVIHYAHNQRGQYREKCSECVRLHEIGQGHLGCHFHVARPCVWRKGCPPESNVVSNSLKQSNKDGENYVVNGSEALTPFDLLKIRAYLLSSNQIEGNIINDQYFIFLIIRSTTMDAYFNISQIVFEKWRGNRR